MLYAPNKENPTEDPIAIKKAVRLPNFFIKKAIGIVNSAVPTIIEATGNVANSEDGARVVPIIPPINTTKDEQDIIRDNPTVNTHTFFGSFSILIRKREGIGNPQNMTYSSVNSTVLGRTALDIVYRLLLVVNETPTMLIVFEYSSFYIM